MKIRYFSAFAILGLLASCDPAVEEYDAQAFYNESDLANSVEITQPFADYPDVLKFTTNPAKSIQILDETGAVIASGTACDSFKVAPGIPGNFIIRGMSQTGDIITTTKTVTISKYTNVPKSWYNITGNKEGEFSGSTEWVWDEESNGACWGNCGYQAGHGDPVNVPGKWWGAKISEFSGQLQHAVGGALTGEESADAKMVISGGSIKKYAADGTLLATGSFSIKDVEDSKYKIAELVTTNNTVLWPYQINGGGTYVNNFEVTFLNEDYMQLLYAPAGTGSGAEATWWEFKKKGVGVYVNPVAYEKWTHDAYSIVGDDGNKIDKTEVSKVSDGKLIFSYVPLDKPFILKAETIESDNKVIVPEGTEFVDITPKNATLYKVEGKDTTKVTQSGDYFNSLDPGVRYDVTVTYDVEKKVYSVYYNAFDKSSTSLSLIAHADKEIFFDKDKKPVSDTSYTGEKVVSGSITTYTFKDVKLKESGFYFYNNKKEDPYKEKIGYTNITILKGDDKIFVKAGEYEGINLIKLASSIKEPVTIILSIYETINDGSDVYLSAQGAPEDNEE